MIAYRENEGVSSPAAIDTTPPFLFPNVSLDALMRAQELLNASEPNNIWSIMSTAYNVSTGIHDGMSKFNWDVFLHVESEEELESLAGDYQQQDDMGITFVLAGIVFESGLFEAGDAPSFTSTTLKIRTNFSLVLDTSRYRES